MRRGLLAVAAAILAAAPCHAAVLRVSAAASLREPMKEIARRFEAENPGDSVELNFAGSQVLRAQIEQGAPVDVFAGADTIQMDALRARKLTDPAAIFCHNALVVVTPRSGAKVRRLADLARPGTRIVLAGDAVPAGRYANLAIAAMSRSSRFGRGFRNRVMSNVASRESNVRAVLSKVTLGEADAGIVYATDARTAAAKVRVISIPKAFMPVASYPIAMVSGSTRRPLAAAFIRVVRSADGRQILARHGFLP
jgi:molybdate transport system substrate-binding protein